MQGGSMYDILSSKEIDDLFDLISIGEVDADFVYFQKKGKRKF
jgi:hypothetical protein